MAIDALRTARSALLAALVLTLALPTAALAANGLVARSDSEFKLLPGQDRIRVSVNVTLTNRKAPTYSIRPCSAGSAQRCRFKIDYYFDKWGYLFVPSGATNISFSPGVTRRLDKETKDWKQFIVSFPNLNYGRTRKLKVGYDLPGGKPRSQHRTRVMDAYTYFCWHGEPGDSGKVVAQLPAGYQATTFGEQTRTKRTRKGTTITAQVKGSPAKFYACTDAFKPDKLIRTELVSPGGQQVTVEGWPEDPEWSETIAEAVESTLPQLEALIGRPMPLDEVVIREVSKQSLYGYGSQFGLRRALIRLGEHIDDPTTAPRGLAMAWFNDRRIKDDWLQHGLSEWAGMTVGAFGCWPAGEFPGEGKPNLAKWKQLKSKPTEVQEAVVDWQYGAACNAVGDLAEVVGEARMRAVLSALLDGAPKYGPQPAEPRGKPRTATWKDWLDAIDEIGLVPSGESDLRMAEQVLRDIGVASARSLKGRAETRTAYHEALATMDGTHMPRLVTDAMGAWDWKTARQSLPFAASTYAAIMANDAVSDADRETLLAAFESARTAKALRALKAKAASLVSEPEVEPEPDLEPEPAVEPAPVSA